MVLTYLVPGGEFYIEGGNSGQTVLMNGGADVVVEQVSTSNNASGSVSIGALLGGGTISQENTAAGSVSIGSIAAAVAASQQSGASATVSLGSFVAVVSVLQEDLASASATIGLLQCSASISLNTASHIIVLTLA